MKKEKNKQELIIKKVTFDQPGKISLYMEDGSIFIIPLKYFPELQKLPLAKRKEVGIANHRTLIFQHCDSLYHLEDFIGKEELWRMR